MSATTSDGLRCGPFSCRARSTLWKFNSLIACNAWASEYRLKQSDEQATYTGFPPSVERPTQLDTTAQPFPQGRPSGIASPPCPCKKKVHEIGLALQIGQWYFLAAAHSVPTQVCWMTSPSHSPSLQFMDDVAASVTAALAELDRHEARFTAPRTETPAHGTAAQGALARLEGN